MGLFVILWKRRRIEEIMATKPYAKPSKHRWIGTAIGALSLFAFPLIVEPLLGIRLPLREQILTGVLGAAMFLVVAKLLFSGVRRMQTWAPAVRFRFAFTMILFACILAIAYLYTAFS